MSFEWIASWVTVGSFLTFVAVVVWALSKRRADAFAAAAQLPFALPDEAEAGQAALGQGAGHE